MQSHDNKWLRYFRENGYSDVRPLARGMEGEVYRLGAGLIGKVWGRRSFIELKRLQQFYQIVEKASLPFLTPTIHEIQLHDGVIITIERELSGTPLQKYLSHEDECVSPQVLSAFTDILSALSQVSVSVEVRELAVLDERQAFWDGKECWSDALIGLMEKRVSLYGNYLRNRILDFDKKYGRLITLVAGIKSNSLGIVHGDLFGENILVDDTLKPIGVLDFGFLTTAGDPIFDASVTAGIINMYGPHALTIDNSAMEHFAKTLGYSSETMLIYRAVYAVITSNAYDAHGQDGHFEWCVRMLERNDVKEILST